MTHLDILIKHALKYMLAFLKWMALAVTVGALCGAAGSLFHLALDSVTELRTVWRGLIWLLPLGGVLTALVYRVCRMDINTGTNLVFDSVAGEKHIPALLAPVIFISTCLSHLFGASVGREGAALQLGGSIGHNFGRLFRFDGPDIKVLSMCGMSACFSALFGTPITASIFVLEVISVGSLHYSAFLPCVVASYTSFAISGAFGIAPMSFAMSGSAPAFGWLSALQVTGLAALCALVSIIFCVTVHFSSNFLQRFIKNDYLRLALGGALMAALTLIFGLYDYTGAGTDIIHLAMNGSAEPFAFALKLLLTALCVGAGFRGGEIVPTMFIGATLGCAAAPLLGLDASFGAAVGLVVLFCSVVNCPIASVFLAVELFGIIDMPLFVLAVAVSFVLSGYFGLYSSQRIIFSKIKEQVRTEDTADELK